MRRFDRRSRAKDILFTSIFVLAMLCIRSSVFASYIVPSGSMTPTILPGDFFFANKLAYGLKIPFTEKTLVRWSCPSRGDIVLFSRPGPDGRVLTKRVIGLPGDRVEIRNKRLLVNGRPAGEKPRPGTDGFATGKETAGDRAWTVRYSRRGTAVDDLGPVVVPPGHVFVLGDNRDDSLDSRYWGCLPDGMIDGTLALRWFSVDRERLRPRLDRIGLM